LLELGGSGNPLSARMQKQDEPVALRPQADARHPTPGPAVAGNRPQTPADGARPRPPVEQPWTVRLDGDTTLYSIAVRHLGSGARWREIARLNGWSEADVRRLAKGTVVKLPAK
jgi:hypothetical protein